MGDHFRTHWQVQAPQCSLRKARPRPAEWTIEDDDMPLAVATAEWMLWMLDGRSRDLKRMCNVVKAGGLASGMGSWRCGCFGHCWTVRPGTLPTEERKYHKSRKITKLCVFHATHPPKHSGVLKSQRTRSGSVTHLRVSLSACFERVSGHPKLHPKRVNTDRTARRPVQRHSPHIFAIRVDFERIHFSMTFTIKFLFGGFSL